MANAVGGRTLNLTEVNVSFNDTFGTNPHVTVRVTRADLPTFFARIWGRLTVTVSASATAEAYNPSGMAAAGLTTIPVALTCVKPWLLPNLDPSGPGTIFSPTDGSILTTTLLGYVANIPPANRLRTANPPPALASPWHYYPGDTGPTNFPPPNATSVSCSGSGSFTAYQLSVAGCVQRTIACNSTVNIAASYPPDTDAGAAVNCLAHTAANEGDKVEAAAPSPPFQFAAGADNPVVLAGALAVDSDVFVSSSLVTVPVFDSSTWPPPSYPNVQIVGFVQLFLEPNGLAVPNGGLNPGHIRTQVINMSGCGTAATGQPILGNGASAVPVRLISP